MVIFEDRFDHRPGSFDGVFTREKRTVSSHGVAQKPLVGWFFSWLFFRQVELSLVACELFSWELDAGGKGDGRVG